MDGTTAAILLRAFVIGVLVAAPVGAMAVLTIQRTLLHGWRGGLPTGAGIATADAVYAGLAAFGVSAVSRVLTDYQAPLRIVGGAALLWLGWRALRSQPTAVRESEGDQAPGVASMFASGVGLTLANPFTIMAFAAVFAGAGLVVEPSPASAAVATVGVSLGSLAWWLVLVSIVMAIRRAVSARAVLVVNRIAGGLLMVLGVLAVVAGVGAL